MEKSHLRFEAIEKHAAIDLIVEHHYAHRKCPISWAWGIRDVKQNLVGVLTVGKPVSWSVMCSLVDETAEEMKNNFNARSRDVYELNRLWLHDDLPRNTESRFIGWCLRELKKIKPNLILVSYADGSKQHVGSVYQATNWVYTGQSLPFKDICVEGFGDYRSVPQCLRGGYVYTCAAHGKFPTPYMILKWSRKPLPQPSTRPCPECGLASKRLTTRSWAILEYVVGTDGIKHRVTREERSIKHRYVMCLNPADRKFLVGDWAPQPYPKQHATQTQEDNERYNSAGDNGGIPSMG